MSELSRAITRPQLSPAAKHALQNTPAAAEEIARTTDSDEPIPGVAKHVNGFLKRLKTRFPVGPTSPAWDAWDTKLYGKQIKDLTQAQATECLILLIERHTYRPSVKEVRAVASEIIARDLRLPDPEMRGRQIAAYQEVRRPVPGQNLIAGRTSEDARAAARARLTHLPGWGLGNPSTTPKETPRTRPSDPNHAEKVKRQLEDMRRECEAAGAL